MRYISLILPLGVSQSARRSHARRYMPDISINRALMDTLTEAEREAWVEATPTRVFRYNAVTKQVRAGVPSP